ncbi:LysR family transcriptional regulator [Streptacidiphilus fuscans]|uniref:LysR family transcriptional regulator n=1 Tax=Streptacidiphilus fuscans TaxID=2789292 RepID=A0A931B2Y0_9ACTN|nr:LysR family transcriptional regulator [Streptacidiphilus fuscans]MBF9067692.1 LysR family transcriptional regulator [Streptacidiphilus fuscans]
MDVELRHLRAFVEVARQRSFTHAAEELAITQPALTRTVKQLETTLQVRLFNRSSRHVELTNVGNSFLSQVERVLNELDRAVNALSEQVSIRLGFSWLMPDPWTQRTIGEFERSSGSKVNLVRIDDPLQALQRHAIDIALVRGRVRPTGSVKVVHLFDEPRVAIACAVDSEVSRLDQVHWADVPRWPLVENVVSGATGHWSWAAGEGPREVIETTNYDEWVESVAANRGIGVAPAVGVRRINHPGVTFVPLVDAPPVPVELAYLAHVQEILLRRFIDVAVNAVNAVDR